MIFTLLTAVMAAACGYLLRLLQDREKIELLQLEKRDLEGSLEVEQRVRRRERAEIEKMMQDWEDSNE